MAEEKSFMDYVKAAANWLGENVMPDVYAKVRQGTKEIAQVLPAFPDSIQPVEEIGTLGNPTQLTVNQENGAYEEWQHSQHAVSPPQPEPTVAPPQPERQAEMEL